LLSEKTGSQFSRNQLGGHNMVGSFHLVVVARTSRSSWGKIEEWITLMHSALSDFLPFRSWKQSIILILISDSDGQKFTIAQCHQIADNRRLHVICAVLILFFTKKRRQCNESKKIHKGIGKKMVWKKFE
jgi:hypothetical protein